MTKAEQEQAQRGAIESDRRQGFHVGRHEAAGLTVCWKVLDGSGRTKAGQVSAKAYRGRGAKPIWFYRFQDQERAEKYIGEQIESHMKWKEDRAADKKKRDDLDARKNWAVGDVISNSWGYDQTNVDFYEVVRVSKKSIWIREIAKNSNDHGQPQGGKCAPRRGEYLTITGKPSPTLRKLGTEWVSMPCGAGRKWDGKAMYTSSTH